MAARPAFIVGMRQRPNTKESIMCDCYEHQCDHKGCREKIPIPLGGFYTFRSEIRAYCLKHLADALNYDHFAYFRCRDQINNVNLPL